MDFKDRLMWFIRIFMLIAVVLFLVFLVGKTNRLGATTHDLEYTIYLSRAVNKLSYEDPVSGRVYQGVLDLSKFRQETLQAEFGPETQNNFAMFFELYDLGGRRVSGAEPFYYNKDSYEFIEPLTFSKPFIKKTASHYVLFRDSEDTLKQGLLNIILVYEMKK